MNNYKRRNKRKRVKTFSNNDYNFNESLNNDIRSRIIRIVLNVFD